VGGAGGVADALTGNPGVAGGDGLVVITYASPDMQVLFEGTEIALGTTNVFPTTSPNVAVSRTYAVTNLVSATGNLLLTNSPAVVFSESGTTSYNGFTIIANITGAATNLAAGDNEPFTIEFTAAEFGSYSATVTIAYYDPIESAYTFTVTADVIPISSVSSADSILGRRQDNSPALGYYPDVANSLVGMTGSTGNSERECRNVVLGYTLPNLPAGKVVSGATLTFEITAVRDSGETDPALDVYILTNASPETTGIALYYHGPSLSTDAAKLAGSTYIEAGDVQVNVNQQVTYSLTGEALDVVKQFYGLDETPDVDRSLLPLQHG
jgi:hypothetical protein